MYALEELAWAIMQERQARPLRSPERPNRRSGVPLRARVARALVHAGVRLDRSAADALRRPAKIDPGSSLDGNADCGRFRDTADRNAKAA